ncbi:Lipoprotein, partial [Dysosmobacter welbionis]
GPVRFLAAPGPAGRGHEQLQPDPPAGVPGDPDPTPRRHQLHG